MKLLSKNPIENNIIKKEIEYFEIAMKHMLETYAMYFPGATELGPKVVPDLSSIREDLKHMTIKMKVFDTKMLEHLDQLRRECLSKQS
jgi:hypothetical protein